MSCAGGKAVEQLEGAEGGRDFLAVNPAPVSRERMAQWLSAMETTSLDHTLVSRALAGILTAIARSGKTNARLMISPLVPLASRAHSSVVLKALPPRRLCVY